MILCGNTKFNGLLYGGIFCIVYFLWFCFVTIKNKTIEKITRYKICIKIGLYFAILALVTIFWAGNSAYYTNLIRHNTITYPLTGENPIDVMATPFKDENHFKNILISLFSELDDTRFGTENYYLPKLKIPFTIHGIKEIKRLVACDNNLSGFGMFFSGIFVISVFAIVIKLWTMHKNWKFYFLILGVILNLGLCFSVTASWMARYAPYVYFIVLIGSYIILSTNRLGNRVKLIFSFLVIVNSSAFIAGMYPTLLYTYNTQKTISRIKEANNSICIDTRFPGHYFNLQDNRISYVVKKDISDNDPDDMLFFPPKTKYVRWMALDSAK